MQFNKLRLTGFKSFVEPTEFLIEPGLTGVVGPNGCGKSNLVEALRWVMGENSPKKMRGNAMDDVIFAGTSTRPSRNLAEVTLVLDNTTRQAPAAFNELTELEITRRIEREQGSAYRINGNEVRARDVQLLFADLASGAHSTAMVSQGRVGALIAAKPTDRRVLLEEAAGITGLHSRRHEAELRLRAAEQNLERVVDVLGQLDQQLQALKRQARQANRYRNISGLIRKAEATMFHLRYTQASEALAAAQAALAEAETAVAERTLAAAEAQTAEAVAAEALPPLRMTEAEAAAALHRLAVARDGLDAEERRAQEQQAQLQARIAQIADDTAREAALGQEAAESMARLDGEAQEIEAARAGEAEAEVAAAAESEQRLFAVGQRQQDLDTLTERAATEQASRRRLNEALADAGRRIERLTLRLNEIGSERDRLNAGGGDIASSATAEAEVEAARAKTLSAREALEGAETARGTASGAENAARETLQHWHAQATRLGAEEAGLTKLLAVNESDLWPPLIDAVTVSPGYEKALGAALGEDLNAAADVAAPVHWEVLPPFESAPGLPEGVQPLANFVDAPAALARRLAQIGLVEDADGPRLLSLLRPGQRLVSRNGGLWRWDGFTAGTGAPTAASVRLEQRNRLADLRAELRTVNAQRADAEAAFEAARAAHAATIEAEKAARHASREADATLNIARDAQAEAVRKAAARASRLAALAEAEDGARRDLTEQQARQQGDSEALSALPPEEEARNLIATLRIELENLRQKLAEARATLDQLRRDAAMRSRRLEAIAIERRSASFRADGAAEQSQQLALRHAEAATSLAEVEKIPAEIAIRRQALLEQIGLAEATRSQAADALANAEASLAECARTLRAAQDQLGEARELRVRREADTEHAVSVQTDLAARIRETLECAPDQVLAAGEVDPEEEMPDLAAIDMKLDRLKKERDNMGPVNLRAELEANEVEERLNALTSEREDLLQAIERLRQGIASLNKEGRERLLTAFAQVNEHFQKLFVQVFGGGRAHLELTGSDDPLEAGLEIMASPPGKRLQTMTLLSGGEQALTALSLLFAVFMTNPAPICVLDEVDAPLDDANVERLCTLLDVMAKSGDTRFLVVTHHPITMARMDRLFGVTMAERGISTLVSVNLTEVQELKGAA